jgi:hypothetical protein
MSLRCYFGIHKYKANHKHLGTTTFNAKMPNGEVYPMAYETIIIAKAKCVRCGKDFDPKWALPPLEDSNDDAKQRSST